MLYQQYWYLLIGAPTITLVFLPYMMCDTYVDENYIGSRVNPDLNCNSDIYTGLRWGLAFVFLLI